MFGCECFISTKSIHSSLLSWRDRYLKKIKDQSTVPKFLLQVSVREIHNRLVSVTNDSGIKDARYEDGKIIISDSIFRSLLPHQLKQMSARYKIMRGCEFFIFAKSKHSSLLSWSDRYLKKN